jgi:hypothetical protein
MLALNDPRWQTFKGGYQVPYNASIPLRALEKAASREEEKRILKELWQELHHQGDVNVASYLALPHLIRIANSKKLTNWDIPALVAVIEVQRHTNNEPLPLEFIPEYEQEIKGIIDVIKFNQNQKWDTVYAASAAAALAAVNGQIELARVIIELEDGELAKKFGKFMEHYDEFDEWLADRDE